MKDFRKTIITAAVTGSVHTPGMSPYLPATPEQIIKDAVGAAQAGAAVVHIHARNKEDGSPSSSISIMQEIVSEIKAQSDVAICITTGGQVGMSLEERIAVVPALKPELASCNAGSINFCLTPASDALTTPVHDWEKKFLDSTWDLIFSNTFRGIEYYTKTMYEQGTCPEFEIYDVGMINNLAYMLQKNLIKGPIYIQFVLGILGGMPASAENLAFMLNKTNELIGRGNYTWSCAAAGRFQFPLLATAAGMGGHVRVGLEDNLFLRKGVLAKSSGEGVLQAKEILASLSCVAATADEAREILNLKGKDKVNF